MLLELWRKILFFLRRNSRNDELDEEMRLHVDLRAARYQDGGMEAAEAVYMARRGFGNRTQLREESREMWGWNRVEELARNLRHATRVLRKSPGFTAVAILSLALGIGANTAVFSFVHAIVLKKLPVSGAERLVILRQQNEMFHIENCCFPYSFFRELRRQDADFQDVLALNSIEVNLSDHEQTEKLKGEIVSGNYFRMLGVRAAAGRLIEDSDDQAEGGGRVCVVSYRLWQERFGGRADAIGRRVMLNGEPFQIAGVSQRGFTGASLHDPRDLQIPSSMTKTLLGDSRGASGWPELIALLKPGVSPAQAETRLNVHGPQIEKVTGPQMSARDEFLVRDGSQGTDSRKEQLGRPVLLLLLLVAVVLLVACTNLTALLLVRSVERTREAGLRMALGASRPAVFRQFVIESLVLAAIGGVAGWAVSQELTKVLLGLLGPINEGLALHLRPDAVIFGFSVAITLAAGIIFGTLPAWRASHADPLRAIQGVAVLRPGRRSLASRLLIAGQIALSLAMMFAAGLFSQTLHNLRSIDLGFRPENVALVHIDLSRTTYASGGASQYFEELLRRVRDLPETRAAGLASISVLSGSMQSVSLQVPGYVPPNRIPPTTYFMTVSSGYFRTLGLPLLAGSDFTANDRESGEGVAIVNEQFAHQFFGGDALGKTFSFGSGRKVRVTGIAGTAKFRRIREEANPVFYVPVTQGTFPRALYLLVRSAQEPPAAMARLAALVRGMDSRVPPDSITTMEMQIDQALGRERLLAFLSALLGGLAVALATIGLYGVLSFSVVRRTREIGIRVAVGAPRSRILALFLAESAWIVLGGIAAGIPLALGCGRLAASLLYGLKPQDAGTVAIATVLLALAAFAAALIPAWRAARLNAVVALRYE
jgi:predicted permease